MNCPLGQMDKCVFVGTEGDPKVATACTRGFVHAAGGFYLFLQCKMSGIIKFYAGDGFTNIVANNISQILTVPDNFLLKKQNINVCF